MDLRQAIRERRSIRVFRPGAVGPDEIEAMKEAIRWAPSAGNVQARKFLFVTRADAVQTLGQTSYQPEIFVSVPLVVVGCTHDRIRPHYGQRGMDLYAPQDVAAATQNLLLTIHALGLGAVWIGAFDAGKVKKSLELERGLEPVVLVPVGLPAEVPARPETLAEADLFGHVS